jgi:tetratricopeptide (TPR) repeat protein
MESQKQKLAFVFGNLPTIEEVDQFQLLKDTFEVSVVTSESICTYLAETSCFQDLQVISLPDHDENPSFLPGLEDVLKEFDLVVVKERSALFAFQAVKAKWRNNFRLAILADNLAPFPGEDVVEMRTIRQEVCSAADLFIVQTEAARQALIVEGIEQERIELLRPWVDARIKSSPKTRASAREALKIAESNFVITYFGQIEWEEGLADLVYAVKRIKQENAKLYQNMRIVLCGIGSYGTQLRGTMVNLGIDENIIFVLPTREAFSTIWQAADVLFTSSIPSQDRIEGDPYRILAAMNHGVPVLAPRNALVDELCGKHRFDFTAGSVRSLVTAIVKSSQTQALRKDLIKKTADIVKKKFGRDSVAKEMTELFNKISKLSPSSESNMDDHQVHEIESLVASKQYVSAINLIDALFQNPELPSHHRANLYRIIGDCFAKLGDSDAAKEAYIKALDIDAYLAKAYLGLGTLGLMKGSNDIAVIHFQKAVSLAPEDEMANLGLGLAFQNMQESSEATKWVLKSLQIDPYNTAAIYCIVKLSYETEQFDDAKQVLEDYIVKHPNDHAMMYTLGGIQFRQNNLETVITTMNTILASNPLDERAQSLLSQAKKTQEKQATLSNG